MRSLYLALILCLFIIGNTAIPIAWNITNSNNGDWSVAQNWIPQQVPSSGDIATLADGITVTVSSNTQVDQLILAVNVVLIVKSNSQLTVNNNVTQVAGAVTIQTEAGSTFSCPNYFLFTGFAVNFINFGQSSLNPNVVGPVTQGVLSNVPQANNVVFLGTKSNLINSQFYVPTGFQFAQTAQTFTQPAGATGNVRFAYTETIPTNGWVFDNNAVVPVNIQFLNGANINGAISVTQNANGNPRPTVLFVGSFTVGSPLTLDCQPTFGNSANVVSFNGATLSFNFNTFGIAFNTNFLQGTSTITLSNTNAIIPTTLTVSRTMTIASNLVFSSNWIFLGTGQTVTFTNSVSLNFNLTTTALSLVYSQPTTFQTGILLLANGVGGKFTFTNGIIANNGVTFNGALPVLDCTSGNNKAFQITGAAALTFPNGVIINGCSVSSSVTLNIQGGVTTSGGNTTLPAAPTTSFTGSINFAAANVPTQSLYSITLGGQVTIPNGNQYSADSVEVVLPSATVFTVGDGSTVGSSNAGLFSLNGGINLGSGCTVNALTAFPAGNAAINANAKVTWNGNILLRNTNLGGSGDLWFYGSLSAVKGSSSITNSNLKFKSGVTLNYLWDGFLPNSGCQVVINSAGASGTRTIEGAVTANTNSALVFDDNLIFNVTVTISGAANPTPVGTVTFRTNGLTSANITTTSTQTVTFDGYIFFNHTNFHLMGTGSYATNANTRFYVQGGLNNPTVNGDNVFNIVNDIYFGVVSNSVVGTTISINAGLTTDDLDNNPNTASTTLTLASLTTQTRNVQGAYVLGSSLTFGGNVLLSSGNTVDSIGTITILGNTVTLSASPLWKNKVVITGATTVNALSTNTWTLGEQAPNHGFNIPSSLTVLSPASLSFSGVYTVNFQTASTLGGNGGLAFTDSFIGGNAAVTISPQSLTLNNATFFGTGTFTVSPANGNLQVANLFRSYVPLTYTGSQLNALNPTTITNTISFTANPITLTGSTLTVSTGSYSVSTRWVLNTNVVFLGATTLQTTGSFAGQGALTFNNSLILTQSTTISNPITFGQANTYIVTVANGGFTLTLTSPSVTVAAIVVSNGGSIVSTSPLPTLQQISGGGVINSDWTWTNTVQFGTLNVTGTRTLTFNLALTSGQTTYFTDGVTFNGGTFVPLQVNDAPTLAVEKFITTSVATLLVPQVAVTITGISFNFQGSSVLTLNGTFNCFSTITFAQNVIFGYLTTTTANPINIRTGTTAWYVSGSTIQLQLWRTNLNVIDASIIVGIYPNIIFGMNTFTATTSFGSDSLTFFGTLNVQGLSLSGSGPNVNLGSLTIVSAQNNTVSGFVLLGALTFNSTTTPFVETVFAPVGSLTQTLILNGPVRMATPTFGPQAQILGPARVAITDSLTVSSAFQFGAPVQLYVTQAQGTFSFTLSGSQTYLTFTGTPSLFNPLGFNLLSSPNFQLTSANRYNILKFSLNSTFNIGNLAVNSGILQLTSSTTNAALVNVAGLATLWIDGNTFNANQVIFSQNPDGTNPSYYQLTVSSLTPPAITTGAVVYKGAASLVVVNFNWNGQAINGITATSSNGASANFLAVTGTPGYQYQSVRNGNSVQFTRSANPTTSPFPTQSNGPSPAVSASSIVSLNIFLFAIIVIFFIFN